MREADFVLAQMPELSHWRDEGVEWSPEQSDVLQWAFEQPVVREAFGRWLMHMARRRRVFRYVKERRKWVGVGRAKIEELIAHRMRAISEGRSKPRKAFAGRPLKATDEEVLAALEAARVAAVEAGFGPGASRRAEIMRRLAAALNVSLTTAHRARVRLTEESKWPDWWDENPTSKSPTQFKPKVTAEEFAAVAALPVAEAAKALGVSERTVIRYRAKAKTEALSEPVDW